jgi:hypothetical protein
MNITEYVDSVGLPMKYNLPTICISIYKNKIIFTTKKNGSRYFEDIAANRDSLKPHQIYRQSIDLLPIQFESINNEMDERMIYGEYYFDKSPHSYIDIDTFFDKLNIEKISDLFSDKVTNNWELIFIFRHPLKRTLTGYVELVDSYFGKLISQEHSKHITMKYFNLPPMDSADISFSKLTDEAIISILNEYSLHIGDALIRDEHTNAYNMFLNSFIRNHNLINKIQLIDLDDMEQMAIFPKIAQPSNKKYLTKWLNEKNKFYIDSLLHSIQFFLQSETDAYDELKKLSKK